jgi:hypothetical protein
MLFYCLDFAYDELRKTPLSNWNRDGHHLFTWHVMLLPMEEQAHLYFINDASGFTIILRYGLEDEIEIDYNQLQAIVFEQMKELGISIDLIDMYFDITPVMNVSAFYHLQHVDEIIDFLSQINEELLEIFDIKAFIQKDAFMLINNTVLGKWFGEDMNDTPTHIIKKTMEKELGVFLKIKSVNQ